MVDQNGWPEWSKYVLSEIKDLKGSVDKLDEKVTKLRIEVAGLKVKAGIWGGIAGLIPVVATALYLLLK